MTDAPLLERVIQASGLSPLFARSAIVRAISRAGVAPDALTPQTLSAALPEIERTLATFLEGDTPKAMRRLQELVR
jgi:hypothetical protein